MDAVLAAGIARVIVGHRDPSPHVGGRGLRKLRAAGVAVEAGLLEEACRELHRGFLSVKTWFEGEPGHSSEARALEDNALHQAARWAAAALDVAASRKRSAEDPGSCLNLGILQGGSKSELVRDLPVDEPVYVRPSPQVFREPRIRLEYPPVPRDPLDETERAVP